MTAGEYDSVRSSATTTFLVAPGHVMPEAESVIETTERFQIVEKEGEAAQVAIETEPA